MLPNTHIKLAEFTLDQVRGRGIYLNENLFKIGNVIPDFSPYHKLIRHYQDNSLDYVEKTVAQIITSNDINEISFKAGIVSHYLADYFCYPHFNNMKFDSTQILNHIKYEKKLNNYIESYMEHHKENVDEYKFKNIEQIISCNVKAYNNSKDFDEDIHTALSIINNFVINSASWSPKLILT